MVGDRPGAGWRPTSGALAARGVQSASWYHFPDHVADLDALLEAVSPDAPVDLVGHSWAVRSGALRGCAARAGCRLVVLDGLGLCSRQATSPWTASAVPRRPPPTAPTPSRGDPGSRCGPNAAGEPDPTDAHAIPLASTGRRKTRRGTASSGLTTPAPRAPEHPAARRTRALRAGHPGPDPCDLGTRQLHPRPFGFSGSRGWRGAVHGAPCEPHAHHRVPRRGGSPHRGLPLSGPSVGRAVAPGRLRGPGRR